MRRAHIEPHDQVSVGAVSVPRAPSAVIPYSWIIHVSPQLYLLWGNHLSPVSSSLPAERRHVGFSAGQSTASGVTGLFG